ncbi:MAG: hypothetical protein RL660_3015 [Bacteroidota bacterium]|jgi:gliding motility-associated-like protein
MFFIQQVHAQINITTGVNATNLVQKLVGTGVTFSGATLTCNSSGSGTFTSTNVALGLDSGVLLTTGYARNTGAFTGANNAASDLASENRPSNAMDADLYALTNVNTSEFQDLCKLEFDFVPQGDTLKFQYKFASDEYPDYVCTNYNDIFAFFIQGTPQFSAATNLAIVPGTTIPVAINSINSGTPGSQAFSSAPCTGMGVGSPFTTLFYNNSLSTSIVYDGMTTLLTATAVVTPCSTYHMKFAIADIIDGSYDSGVFLKAGSFSSNSLTIDTVLSPTALPIGWPYSTEGCNTDTIVVRRFSGLSQAQTVYITLSGTATNGVDYATIPSTITIPAGDSVGKFWIVPFNDAIPEGTETVYIGIAATSCSSNFSDTMSVLINEFPTYSVTDNDTICLGQTKVLAATVTPPNPYLTFTWNPGNINLSAVSVTPLSTSTYTVTAKYPGCPSRDSIVKINVSGYPSVNAGPDTTICANGSTQLNATVASNITYPIATTTWTPSGSLSNSTILTPVATPPGTTTYTITAVNIAGCTGTDVVVVNVKPNLNLSLANTAVNCANANGTITASTSAPLGTTINYNLQPGNVNNTTGSFSNLTGGITYTVTATNTAYCVATATTILSAVSPISWASFTFSSITCNNLNNGSITSLVSGGNGTVNYTLSPGGQTNTTGSFSNLSANTYTIQAVDQLGCSTSTTATIINPPAISVTANSSNSNLCNGASTASISYAVSGGSGNILYSLNGNTGVSSGNFTGLSAGLYTVVASDINGCSLSIVYNLQDPPGTSLTVSNIVNAICLPNNSGSFTASGSGGTGTLTYSANAGSGIINNGSSGNFSNLVTGVYTVVLTDGNGCTRTATANVGSVPLPIVNSVSTNSVTCFGGNNGTINLSVTNGTGAITWSITPTITNNNNGSFSGASANTYVIVATDASSCTVSTSVSIQQPSGLSFGATSATGTLCNSVANGTITTSASGGTGSLLYTLLNTSATSTTGSFGSLIAATYTIQASDANGCTATTTIAVTQPSSLSWNTITANHVSCNSGNNGSISLTTNGGTGTKLYSLNGGAGITASTFTGLTAGNYTIVVSDANNCNLNTVVTITQPTPLSFATINNTPVSCSPGNDALITAQAQGGTGVYTYALNAGAFTSNASWPNQGAGLYTVTVKDNNNCTYSAFYSVLAPTNPIITSVIPTAAKCSPSTSGSFAITVTGNGNPLQYSVGSGFGGLNVLDNLSPGTYTITAADNYGCSHTTISTIVQTVSPSFVSTGLSSYASCSVGCDGVLVFEFTSPNYSVLLANSAGLSKYCTAGLDSLGGICVGIDAYYVTDTLTGCADTTYAAMATSTVTTSAVGVNINCFGGNDGSITVTSSTDITSVIDVYLNGNNMQTGTSVIYSNLSAGTYTVYAVNSQGCGSQSIITLTQPNIVAITSATTNGALCYNGATGSCTIAASGGAGTYTYTLQGAGTQNTTGIFNNLVGPNTYTISAQDANACSTSTIIVITSPSILAGASASTTAANCFGSNTGSLTISGASGGAGSYTYQLNPGAQSNTTGIFNSLQNANYVITVSDANGCSITTTAVVSSPPQLVYALPTIVPVTCNGAGNGSVSATLSGGTPSYTFTLNGSNSSSTASYTGLSGGTYTILATDANTCTAALIIQINEPAILTASNTTQNVSCFNANNGSVTTTISGGNTTFTYTLLPSGTSNSTGIFSSLAPSSYTVQVIDNKGCSATSTFGITQPTALSIDSAKSINPSCSGGSNSNIQIYSSGGTMPKQYTLQPGSITNNTGAFGNLIAGNYTISVQDANGCTINTTVSLVAPAPIILNNVSVTHVFCNGDSTGSINANASGGTGTLIYSLQPGAFANASGSFNNIPAAAYVLTVTDANNCTTATFVTITENAAIDFTSVIFENPRCSQGTDGFINALATGGNGTIVYRLNLNTTDNPTGNFTNLGLGTYTIAAIDAVGCRATTTVTLNTPQDLVVSAPNTTATVCPDKADAVIQAIATFGNPGGYIFSISPGIQTNNTGLFTNLAAGNYTIQVVDSKGCSGSALVQVVGSNTDINVVLDITPVSCNSLSGNDGKITPIASSGVPPYLHYWPQAKDTIAVLTNVSPGTYEVLTVDANGCTSLDTAVLSPPPCCEVYMPNAFTPDGNGLNDMYKPAGPADIIIIQFDIFDRWGNQVFSGAKTTKAWDGKRNGNNLDMDTYFYVLRYFCLYDKKEYSRSGDVILTR